VDRIDVPELVAGEQALKILLFIDDLGSGGAQRQVTNLALALKARNIDVQLAIYHAAPGDIFRPAIDAAGIVVHRLTKKRKYSLDIPLQLSRLMRQNRFDAVFSFLDAANFYAEIARLLNPGQRLIVSERSSYLAETGAVLPLVRRIFHGFASVIVCNSESQTEWLKRFPWLRRKVVTIYNGYQFPEWTPLVPPVGGAIKLLAIGRLYPLKNPKLLAQAMIGLFEKTGKMPHLTWVGRTESSAADRCYVDETRALIASHPVLARHWLWAGEQADVTPFLNDCHALIHPSDCEGLPNVICEALLAGRPVLATDICDNGRLVVSGQRGLLFGELSSQGIAAMIAELYNLDDDRWQKWTQNARAFAVGNLSIDRMCDEFLALASADKGIEP
jgi:glycosyltransferase involved in cell wall biosynthesis